MVRRRKKRRRRGLHKEQRLGLINYVEEKKKDGREGVKPCFDVKFLLYTPRSMGDAFDGNPVGVRQKIMEEVQRKKWDALNGGYEEKNNWVCGLPV